MDQNWVKIYSTTVTYRAELLKGMLQENGIEAVLINKKDSAYLFGEVDLYVQGDQVIKAQHLIKTTGEL